MKQFFIKNTLETPIEKVFFYFLKPESLLRITPSSFYLRKISHDESRVYKGFFLGFPFSMKSNLSSLTDKGFSLEIKLASPFFQIVRDLSFQTSGSNKTEVDENISYSFMFWETKGVKKLKDALQYGQRVLKEDLSRLQSTSHPFTILLTGGSGFIGKQLTYFLRCLGHKVYHFSRKASSSPFVIPWDPQHGLTSFSSIPKADVAIHLAGENIFGLWTKAKKKKILESRVEATKFLSQLVESERMKLKLVISASADGIYPLISKETITETSPLGDHFLARVCKQWESASIKIPAERHVQARLSPVFSLHGGLLKKAYSLFSIGLGAIFGTGNERFSWVYLDDVIYQFHHILHTTSLSGPVNIVSPHPTTNGEWSQYLAKALQRPLWIRLPRFILILVGRDFATNVLLTDRTVYPKKIIDSGTSFAYPNIEDCLCHIVGCNQRLSSTLEE